jgi:hypothetical protein
MPAFFFCKKARGREYRPLNGWHSSNPPMRVVLTQPPASLKGRQSSSPALANGNWPALGNDPHKASNAESVVSHTRSDPGENAGLREPGKSG